MKVILIIVLIFSYLSLSTISANQDEFEKLETLTCKDLFAMPEEEAYFILEVLGTGIVYTYNIPLDLVEENEDNIRASIESTCANEMDMKLYVVIEEKLKKISPNSVKIKSSIWSDTKECHEYEISPEDTAIMKSGSNQEKDQMLQKIPYKCWPERAKIDPVLGNIDRASAMTDRKNNDREYLQRIGVSPCNGRAAGIKDSSKDLPNLKLPYPAGKSNLFGQGWGGKNTHYVEGNEHMIDFAMEEGVDLVLAVGPGRVMSVREDSEIKCDRNCAEGNYVTVDHGNGYYGFYGHLHPYSVLVEPGDVITEGNFVLAKSGCSGWCSNPHLHFVLRDMDENCTVEYTLDGISDFTDIGRDDFLSGNKVKATRGKNYLSTNYGDQVWDENKISKIGKNRFYKNGIILNNEISWTNNKVGDKIKISGQIIDDKSEILIWLSDERLSGTDANISESIRQVKNEINEDNTFEIFYEIPEIPAGIYTLAITTIPAGHLRGMPSFLIEESN